MEFNKEGFTQFRKELMEALDAVGSRNNLSIKPGKISYSDYSFNMRLECTKTDAGDVKKMDFEQFCGLFQLDPGDYQKQFTVKGKTYRLDDLNLNAPKMPCVCTEMGSGQQYKMNLDMVREALGYKKKGTP